MLNRVKYVFVGFFSAMFFVASPAYSTEVNLSFNLKNNTVETLFQPFSSHPAQIFAKSKRNAGMAQSMAKPKKMKRAKKGKGGGENSQAAEERRLIRECKGRPNSGACLGYAS